MIIPLYYNLSMYWGTLTFKSNRSTNTSSQMIRLWAATYTSSLILSQKHLLNECNEFSVSVSNLGQQAEVTFAVPTASPQAGEPSPRGVLWPVKPTVDGFHFIRSPGHLAVCNWLDWFPVSGPPTLVSGCQSAAVRHLLLVASWRPGRDLFLLSCRLRGRLLPLVLHWQSGRLLLSACFSFNTITSAILPGCCLNSPNPFTLSENVKILPDLESELAWSRTCLILITLIVD